MKSVHMIIAFLELLIPVVFGISLITKYKLVKEKVTTATLGIVAGLAIFITITYLLDLALPISSLLIAVTLAILTGISAYFIQQGAWHNWKKMKTDKTALILAVVLIILAAIISPKLLIEKPDGLYTGVLNAFGDAPWHAANITAFAQEQTVPPENPIFAGTRLTYPFLSDYFSALLLIGGASLALSMNLPAFLLIPVTFLMLYALAKRYTKGNKWAAIITVILVLFSGATFGWTNFTQDMAAADQSFFELITHLPAADYSGDTEVAGFNFLNSIMALLLPQRSFLFGMPLAFGILFLLHPSKKKTNRKTMFIAAGVLAGLLPLFHAHTVLALIPMILALMLLTPSIYWIYFLLSAAIIGFPEVFYYFLSDNSSQSFFRIQSGWMAGDTSPIWYWFKNSGFLIPAAIIGLFIKKSPTPLKALTISGFILFIAANTLAFAPWVWDNMKILIFWLIFTAPMIGWLAMYLIKQKKVPFIRTLVVIFILLHTFSAALDIWKLALPTSPTWQEWSNAGIAISEKIKNETDPQDSILGIPIHNSPIVLSGRAMYMGFPGHVWSHGGTYQKREQAIAQYFAGSTDILVERHPEYVLIGPHTERLYPNIVIRPAWEIVAQSSPYTLYKIP